MTPLLLLLLPKSIETPAAATVGPLLPLLLLSSGKSVTESLLWLLLPTTLLLIPSLSSAS
jgi:hypothetical protein